MRTVKQSDNDNPTDIIHDGKGGEKYLQAQGDFLA